MTHTEFCEKTGIDISQNYFEVYVEPVYMRFGVFTNQTQFIDYVKVVGLTQVHSDRDRLGAIDKKANSMKNEARACKAVVNELTAQKKGLTGHKGVKGY